MNACLNHEIHSQKNETRKVWDYSKVVSEWVPQSHNRQPHNTTWVALFLVSQLKQGEIPRENDIILYPEMHMPILRVAFRET